MKRDRESSSDDSDDGIILTRNRKRERMKVLQQKFLKACVSGKFKDVEKTPNNTHTSSQGDEKEERTLSP